MVMCTNLLQVCWCVWERFSHLSASKFRRITSVLQLFNLRLHLTQLGVYIAAFVCEWVSACVGRLSRHPSRFVELKYFKR